MSSTNPTDLSNTSQTLESPCQETQSTVVDAVLMFIKTKRARDLGTHPVILHRPSKTQSSSSLTYVIEFVSVITKVPLWTDKRDAKSHSLR